MVGALATAGHFTGVEQRKHLASLALDTIKQEQIPNAEIIHTNVTAIDFSAYGAYYLFNPFEENLFKMGRIDSSLELSMEMYNQYTRHVAGELARVPLGTRVATYCGLCDEIPAGYKCEESHFDDALKFWRKTKE
ncbi:conserved hypothetical protein [Chthoniobacter flavus Ellin428]|uniref:Uncharacterized protein n=2 Tax=Chthoniobacter flavus TaxID=191863 RepID=B4D4B6_9BACT|nr:conserved hypothetical protein [Chthoniobacter flavus Ellin428]TCO89043.1 hypothetical protein EV701_11577 [Chthoniobacter flavus]